jgi:hypothetical protein
VLDFIVTTGDLCVFSSSFSGGAVVTAAPTSITGSAVNIKINGKAACLVGDESSAAVLVAPYIAPPFITPGVGTITITLVPDQISDQSLGETKNFIKVGSSFIATFTVTVPAMSIAGTPQPDPLLIKVGSGTFVTSNTLVQTT